MNTRVVAILEARMEAEMASLVRRHGGEPLAVPAVREDTAVDDDEIAREIDALHGQTDAVVVLSTGAALRALSRSAERTGRKHLLLVALARATLVCRGPKPVAALREMGLTPAARTVAPHTTSELLDALFEVRLRDRHTLLLHYGERNEALAAALVERGASLRELSTYSWELPRDLGPLRGLIQQIVRGHVNAIAFTSQVQVRHLFAVADAMDARAELTAAMTKSVLVGAIGPTCAAALEREGVRAHVLPMNPSMGALVAAVLGGGGQENRTKKPRRGDVKQT
jgi:uroporphyrinogen-III synthase